jgi:antitoxin VapB
VGLSIKNDEAERLIRELAKARNTSITRAVTEAVRNELARDAKPRKDPEMIITAVRKIQAEVAKLPILDHRSADEILGYDEFGLPN